MVYLTQRLSSNPFFMAIVIELKTCRADNVSVLIAMSIPGSINQLFLVFLY